MSNELDKHFGERLRGYESELDAEALWQAVKPPPRRRGGFWWLLLLLLLGVGGSVYWWTNTDATKIVPQETGTRVPAPADLASQVLTPEEMAADKHVSAVVADDIATTTKNEEVQVGSAISTEVPSVPGQANAQPSSVAVSMPPVVAEMNTGDVFRNTPSAAAAANKREAINTSTLMEEEAGATAGALAEVEQQNSSASPVAALPTDISLLASRDWTLNKSPEYATFSKKKEGTGLFLGLEGGYFATDRSLSMGNDTLANSEWLSNRQRTETVLDAWSSQVTFGYQHDSGWRLRAGLAFTQLTNVFEWSTTQNTIDSVEGVQQIIVGPTGDSTFLTGPIARYQTSTYFKRTYNRMQQWELPLLIGYRLQQGDWSLVLEGGPRFLLQRSWSGDVLNAETNIEAWDEALEYRSSVSLQSIDLGAQVLYRVGAKVDLGLGLWGRVPLQDFGPEDAAQQERYRLLGGQIGAYYRL